MNVRSLSRRTKIITVAFIVITLVLTIVTIAQKLQSAHPSNAHTRLFLNAQKDTISTITVGIDTQEDEVIAVQLALSYDPHILTNLTMTPGTFFGKPVILANKINQEKGTIFYAVAIAPTGKPVKGKGIIATISFTPNTKGTTLTQLTFLKNTLVTGKGSNTSVLATKSGIKIMLK